MFKFTNESVKNGLAVFVPLSFIGHLALWTFFPPEVVSDKVVGMLQSMLGLHGGWSAMIISYYFNSSASSARKDEIIAASAPPGNGIAVLEAAKLAAVPAAQAAAPPAAKVAAPPAVDAELDARGLTGRDTKATS